MRVMRQVLCAQWNKRTGQLHTSFVGVENCAPFTALEPPSVVPVYTVAVLPFRPGLGSDSQDSVTSGVSPTTGLKKLRIARTANSCAVCRELQKFAIHTMMLSMQQLWQLLHTSSNGSTERDETCCRRFSVNESRSMSDSDELFSNILMTCALGLQTRGSK